MKNFWRVPFITAWVLLTIPISYFLGLGGIIVSYIVTGVYIVFTVDTNSSIRYSVMITLLWLPCLFSDRLLYKIKNMCFKLK